MSKFDILFEPINVGKITLKNRIGMASMSTNTFRDGLATDLSIQYYARRAKGGTGLIGIESTPVDYPIGKPTMNHGSIHHDKCIPGLTKLAAEIHRHGAQCFIELQHAGPLARRAYTGMQPVSSSAIQTTRKNEKPRELSREEIKSIIVKYADAAERTKEAGFDAVEILAAHYYPRQS